MKREAVLAIAILCATTSAICQNMHISPDNYYQYRDSLRVKNPGAAITAAWLQRDEIIPIIIEELERYGFEWIFAYKLYKLQNGQFNVIDDFNREGLLVEPEISMTGKRVVRELNKLVEWRGKPEHIRLDHGPEFICKELSDWAKACYITLVFTPKGQPYRNGYVERFNRSFREEVLSRYLFDNLRKVRAMANAWLWSYNNERPHSSLEYQTPIDFLLNRGNTHMPDGKAFVFATIQKEQDLNRNYLLLSAPN